MADPFLLSHSCAPHEYTLAGPLTPVSIRDQMIRGRMFVDRAIEQALISGHRPLLVVGAGAAGVTAAIRAAELGVPVTLVEASAGAFGRQKHCRTRWVDPTQYDWPADHWQASVYPWTFPAMPLPWPAQLSSVIATIWDREFRRARARYSQLQFQPNSKVVGITYQPASQDLWATVKSGPGLATDTYGAAVWCLGFGLERASLGLYSSFEFWESDPLEQVRIGLPVRSEKYRVLIGGGGDGALQDFLRITTGLHSAGAILQSLPASAQTSVASAIHSSEDQAQRAGIWCEQQHEHAVFKKLHESYRGQVQYLLMNPVTAFGVRSALAAILRHSLELQVTLAYPCDHFSRCYGLNRLLTMLILEYAGKVGLDIQERPANGIFSVTGIGHACANQAAVCHGLEHEVRLQDYPSCGVRKRGPASSYPESFDAVILRLGVSPPAPFASNAPLLITRQILPYHVSQ